MFRAKSKLFLGLVFLTLGIVLKLLIDQDIIGVAFILLGALLKVSYIIGIIRKKYYQPGIELVILGLGLSLFFFGLYLCQNDSFARLFIIAGLIWKTVFVVLFIRKINSK